MRRLLVVLLAALCFSGGVSAQFGGREGDVVLYSLSVKGRPEPVVVAPGTVNTATGFEVIDPLTRPLIPFGPDFPAEFYVNLHVESGDNMRFIVQRENLLIPRNRFLGAGKLMIIQGVDRLIIPGKKPIDLTAGLYAPFPEGVDFGPELPIFEANSFMWTPSPVFPLLQKTDPDYVSPLTPPGLIGSEYVLELGKFAGILRWDALNKLFPGAGWPQGVDFKQIDQDARDGSNVRMIRLRPGRKTPAFVIRANTHLAVLQGSVTITPSNGTPVVLKAKQYAFIPNGFAITLSNPKAYTGPREAETDDVRP